MVKPKKIPKRDRKASARARRDRDARAQRKWFEKEIQTMHEVHKKYDELKKEIAKSPDGVFGIDTKLVMALMCTLFGDPIADRAGTMLLAEHLADRLPAFIGAKREKKG